MAKAKACAVVVEEVEVHGRWLLICFIPFTPEWARIPSALAQPEAMVEPKSPVSIPQHYQCRPPGLLAHPSQWSSQGLLYVACNA